MSIPSRIADAWSSFWFRGGSPYGLAAARIVISVHALWILFSRDLPAIAGLPEVFWSEVPVSRQWRYLVFHGHVDIERLILFVCVAALVATAAGWFPRLAALLAALTLYHLAPLEAIIWTGDPLERGFEVTILSLVVLSLAPTGDVWRLGPPANTHRQSWEYHWALTLIQIFVVQIYLFAGYSKLFRVGIEWISAENLQEWLLVFAQHEPIAVFTRAGPWMAQFDALMFGIALFTVVFELAFPIVLFRPSTRRFMIPLAVALHLGILVTMNIAFLNLPQLLVFVNWDWVRKRLASPRLASRWRLAWVNHLTIPGP